MARIPDLKFEDATILYPNFSGRPDRYRRDGGIRTFNLVLDDHEAAERLKADGWNVRIRAPRNEGEEPEYTVQVTVSYKLYSPSITMINTFGKRTELTEETVHLLDDVTILKADGYINPSRWEMDNGETGIKAYLRELWVTVDEGYFRNKYNVTEDPDM